MITAPALALLEDYLASGQKILTRLNKSMKRIEEVFPLDEVSIVKLSDDQEERLDAFLHRFSSLAASVQDHVGRALLVAEEEDLTEASRKDQRLLLEKIGALDAGLSFSFIAALRNRLVHSYPDDPRRQAEVLNQVYAKASDLITAFEGLAAYAKHKFGLSAGGAVSRS